MTDVQYFCERTGCELALTIKKYANTYKMRIVLCEFIHEPKEYKALVIFENV